MPAAEKFTIHTFYMLPLNKQISANAPGAQILNSQRKSFSVFVQISVLLPRAYLAYFFVRLRRRQLSQLLQIVLVINNFRCFSNKQSNSKVCRMLETLQI